MRLMIKPTRAEKDPTGQAGNRLRAKRDISRRIRATRLEVLALIDLFPVASISTNSARYEYDTDSSRLKYAMDEIKRIITNALGLDNSYSWFFADYTQSGWRSGAMKAYTRLKTIAATVSDSLADSIDPQARMVTPYFLQRFEILNTRSFESMDKFAGDAAVDLGRVLSQGLELGESPRTIAKTIRAKFEDIEGYRALRIARTEINNSFVEGRYESSKDVRDRLGLDVRHMHVSSLVPATRLTHAQRHAKIYTLEDQREWWAQGSNKINCLCSTVEVVFVDGEPTQKNLIKRQEARGRQYFGFSA